MQRTAVDASPVNAVPPLVHEVLQSPGRPLDSDTRSFMEPRFGHDFSDVRVHTDSRAAESAQAVNAVAFTVGRDIVFNAGQYAPSTAAGRRLVAHELTHVVQQAHAPASMQTQLAVGAIDTAAEREADRTASLVNSNAPVPAIPGITASVLQRQPQTGSQGSDVQSEPDFTSPQRRGGRARSTFIDAGRRGQDQVRIAVTRYLCDCRGRNVTRTHASTHIQPGPGVTLEFCRGRVTGRLTGDVVPSSTTTGRATVRGDINIAPGQGGVGARVGVEGEARNTGNEPQVGGRVDVRVGQPGGVQGGVGGEIFRGTRTGQIDTSITGGVDVGPVRITGGVTNPQDRNRIGGTIGIGGDLPGQDIQRDTCRECACPVVYDCLEDIPPRDYQEPVTYTVEDRSRLRYYYQLDTNADTADPVLRQQSRDMIEEVARRVAAGQRVVTITGYASPEDNRERPTPNEQLAVSRGQRLRERLATRLGANAQLPAATGGGELLGRVATIEPGSSLGKAILDVGFGDPEDVTTFLIGSDIPNTQLADQFLQLLGRVTEPADRLRLFGVDASSPAAPRLLGAIERFVSNKGRGRRPWEGIFGFLRYATVELASTRQETRMEDRRTSGSLTPLADARCKPYARQAESEGKFGPSEPEPRDSANCPTGEAHNQAEYASKCDYG